jgi:aldehyde dehydrogenase (NAD+)
MSVTGESRLLIDGKLVEATGRRTYTNLNPATEEAIGAVADATREDMDRAIGAARRAFDETDWPTNLERRAACLRQLQSALEKHKEESRGQIVAEVGTPIMLTYAVQQDSCIADMGWDIRCAEEYAWESELGVHEFFGAKSARLVRREPIGVAGLITPWNFPFMLNLSKIVPALMAGCTAVLKAAPDTPWSATWIGKLIAEETDLPPGVLNIVTASDPAEVGDQLTGDPRVDLVSFTGSTAIGKHIMRRGADSLKRVFLELGGKSAQIFLDDADLLNLVPAAGAGICMHGGQGCAITTRMLLPRSRYAEFFIPSGSTSHVSDGYRASRCLARLPPVRLTAGSCSYGRRFVPRFLQLAPGSHATGLGLAVSYGYLHRSRQVRFLLLESAHAGHTRA